jgi:hypothetical protein
MKTAAAFIEAFDIGIGVAIEWHLVKALNLNPEGVKQHSPGRKPWDWSELEVSPVRAVQAVSPLQGSIRNPLLPRACALGCAASPLRG